MNRAFLELWKGWRTDPTPVVRGLEKLLGMSQPCQRHDVRYITPVLLACENTQWRKVTQMQPDKNKNKDKSHKSHYLQGLVLGPMWKHEVQRGDIYDICTDDDDEVLYFSKKSLNICFVFFNICKLHVLRLKTGLNSPTFKVRNKFCPNLLTYLISLTPTH